MANSKIGFVETPLPVANLMVQLASVPQDAVILDTGCGRGVFLKALQSKGYKNVSAIEINNELYQHCKHKYGKDFHIINGNFLTHKFKNKFDLIIGNPPYVHFNSLPEDVANSVKKIINTSEGDIYYAFIIKAILSLKEGGELIYIIPYHFFYNTYAKFVRETLLNFGKIELIIDLDETRLFRNENPETIIIKFKKGKFLLKNEKIKILNIKTTKTTPEHIQEQALKALNKSTPSELFEYNEIPHYIHSDVWSSHIANIPEFPAVKLKELAKVGVGLVSGFDKAFLITPEKEQLLTDKEKIFVRRFVKGKHCKRYIVKGYEKYLLIDNFIKSEAELKSNYPNIYKILLPFKERMSRRYLPKNTRWFQWMALRNYKFLSENIQAKRIYVPTLDRRPYNRFSIGEGLLPAGDVLFLQPYKSEDLFFLTGFLNSDFFREYYRTKGGKRGGRMSFTQRLLENIEIPAFNSLVKEKITNIVKEIISKSYEGKSVSFQEKELNKIIITAFEKREFEERNIVSLFGLSL